MKIRSYSSSGGTEINVIPLLDVVFSILAFFILISAGLAVPTHIGIDLPQSSRNNISQSGGRQQQEMLLVTLDIRGNLAIGGTVVADNVLEQEIKSYMMKYPQGLVVLNAESPSVSYQQVINKLEDLRRIAGDRVAIATSRS